METKKNVETKQKKRFFANHSKSSARVVSLALYAILAVVALSFVAVTVITKDDQKFESKQVVRPRMPPQEVAGAGEDQEAEAKAEAAPAYCRKKKYQSKHA